MGAVRQDSWKIEDDGLLAELILQQIRSGGTQLEAFQAAAGRLGRTAAACGFRWNSVVRKSYEPEIADARKMRKSKEHVRVVKENSRKHAEIAPAMPLQQVEGEAERLISSDPGQHIASMVQGIAQLISRHAGEWLEPVQQLVRERNQLAGAAERLAAKLNQLQQEHDQMKEDYQTIVEIMERARRMTVFSDETSVPKIRFRMDENGNLEQFM